MDSSADRFAQRAAEHETRNSLSRAAHFAGLAQLSEPFHPLAGLIAARCARREGQLHDALAQLDSVPASQQASEHLHERARIYELQGRAMASLQLYAQANAHRTQHSPEFDRTLLPRHINHIGRCFRRAWVESWTPPEPSERPAPLFMVGFNRSGTTLLDRMLDAHPEVHVLQEQPGIDRARAQLGELYPRGLGTLSSEQLQAARAAYFEVVDANTATDFSGLVIDKLPMNTISLGLINRLFPRAKIVLSLRHPMDVVLSNFKQNYAPNPITCHFDSLASSADLYARVMGLGRHLCAVLPLQVHEVRFEALVHDWEREVRAVLRFAGLEWSEQVQHYLGRTQNQGEIGTPSYDQVVRPIDPTAVGRWRAHADVLAPLSTRLQPFMQAFGYSEATQESA
jgi:hypothetical protein